MPMSLFAFMCNYKKKKTKQLINPPTKQTNEKPRSHDVPLSSLKFSVWHKLALNFQYFCLSPASA